MSRIEVASRILAAMLHDHTPTETLAEFERTPEILKRRQEIDDGLVKAAVRFTDALISECGCYSCLGRLIEKTQ